MTGVSGVVGLGIVGLAVSAFFSNGESTATQTNTSSTGTHTPVGSGNSASVVIAQASAVAQNSAKTFTIPSTGAPGVLIHLPDDRFVAYDTVCTHAGCIVDYNPTSQHLICPCHGATYDPAQQAAVLAGPTKIPLRSVVIHVDSATGAITLG
jgi:thiosulfate dehydrogenase [quinone] large subunit